MKKILLLGLFLTASLFAFSQTKEEYKAENEGWLVKIEDAYAESKKTGKPILANFTGSDWCGWCKSCLLYTSPSPRDATLSRMPSSA